MNLKRLLLITALLAVIAVPAQADKALIRFLDNTGIRVSAGEQLLKEPYRPNGINPFENILVSGEIDPSVRYYIAPKAKAVDGFGNKKNAQTRMTSFRVEYLPIENVGGPPRLLEPIVWEGIIDHSHPDEDGNPIITDPSGHPLARTIIAGVVSYWVLRETVQGVVCLAINLTPGIPVCWNSPWFKSDESGAIFDQEDFAAVLEKLANPKAFRGWLEIIPNSHDLAWVRWQITYEAKAKNTDMAWETKPQSGIFVFDYDEDGYRNDYEIEMGTDPYDPGSYPGQPQYVNVPSVVDQTITQATTILENTNLFLGTVSHAFSNTVPAGHIISQSPVATTQVLVGSAINVVVSDGPQVATTTVPKVVDHHVPQATTILQTAGLVLGTATEVYHPTRPAGFIVLQTPNAGLQVLVGSAVNVVVSKGPEPSDTAVVPSVVDHTVAQATTILQTAGLVLGTVTEVYHPTKPAGCIVSQTPNAGVQVLVGSAVNVVVSKGPQPPDTAVVPSILGKTEAQGTTTLAAVDSRLTMLVIERVYSSSVAEGLILYQDPVGGTTVNLPKVVEVKVSKGPQSPNALTVTITSPADNFVGTVGQAISFACTVTGGVGSYDNFKWHFPDNSFKYQQNVVKTFDIPGAGWCYIDVTDHAGNVAQDKVWVQINAVP
ncbi:MAG: PASTA domain-containing protein [bacterium]|nr:PASTA domain-containing protein [bacterium]